MLVAAAVCPHPPLLVPRVATGAAAELDDLRAACDRAVRHLLAAEPDLLVVVGDAPATGPLPAEAAADLSAYVPGTRLGGGPGPVRLPIAHAIGTWLLDRAAFRGPRELVGIDAASDAGACARLGAELADRTRRVALLAMGDGSARRGVKAPGYVDPRAVPYDEAAAAALGGADASAVLGLDAGLGAELLVAGRASWQVLAGAAGETPQRGQLLASIAPYGVAYFVATWQSTHS